MTTCKKVTGFVIENQGSDPGGTKTKCHVCYDGVGINLKFDGYGMSSALDSDAYIVYIEMWEGELRLVIWNDIVNDDPMIVDLSSARIERRRHEEE